MATPHKYIAILGAGESGVGTALLAQQQGYEVFVSDRGSIGNAYREELRQHGIPFEEGQHTWARLSTAHEVVKSPGIPDTAPLVQQFLAQGTPVISEIEFAARFTRAHIIGITGSNGKTTTTTLTHHLLASAGLDAVMGGNVGYSFARLLTEGSHAHYVLELSSFQLDGIQHFRPDIALLLNITPDHLDRYDYKMENYVAAKFRLITNRAATDPFYYFGQDDNISAWLANHPAEGLATAITAEMITGKTLRCGGMSFDMSSTRLQGQHNYLNALFAIHVAQALGVGEAAIQAGLDSFHPVAHRMEPVANVCGVQYINDSKATNVDAVFYALQAMEAPTVWIVGGQDKGNDYAPLLPLVQEKVSAVVCLGIDNTKLVEVFGPEVAALVQTRSAAEAVQAARALAMPGHTVLLSPACASFDLFKNYIDRGDQFKAAVLALKPDMETDTSGQSTAGTAHGAG